MGREISPERKGAYYFGLALMVIGFLLFASVFFSFALNFGNFGAMERVGSRFPLAFIGMGVIFVGGIFMNVGRRGLAGAGVILNPERTREDVEPWSRMAGGVVKDALNEADISLGATKSGESMPFDDELRRLRKLRDEQIISDDEYAAKKKQILERA